MKTHRQLKQIAAGALLVLIAALVYVRLSAAPVRPFDSEWQVRVGAQVALDAHIRGMARRAQIDNYISGIPPIGRRRLALQTAHRTASGEYDLVFYPSVTHTIVLYHFSPDHRIAWKTCTWTEA
jgi:hypothetical protein